MRCPTSGEGTRDDRPHLHRLMSGPVLQGSPTRRTGLQRDFHRLLDGLLGRPTPVTEPPPPRTTARYRLIPGKGRRRTPSPPHLGFQGSDPLPRLLQLRPEPFQFGQKLLAIRTGGLGGHGPSMIPYPETLNKYPLSFPAEKAGEGIARYANRPGRSNGDKPRAAAAHAGGGRACLQTGFKIPEDPKATFPLLQGPGMTSLSTIHPGFQLGKDGKEVARRFLAASSARTCTAARAFHSAACLPAIYRSPARPLPPIASEERPAECATPVFLIIAPDAPAPCRPALPAPTPDPVQPLACSHGVRGSLRMGAK
jgi:hypothetical protein